MKSIVFAFNFFRENNHVLIFWTEDNAVTLESYKILRRCQSCCYSETADSNVIYVIFAFNKADSGIFNAIDFIVIFRFKSRAVLDLKVNAVFAPGQP